MSFIVALYNSIWAQANSSLSLSSGYSPVEIVASFLYDLACIAFKAVYAFFEASK